jgi:hypothetical protein
MVSDASRMTSFEVLPLSFWRRARNHLIEFEVTPISDRLARAGFAARHGGGVWLLINRLLAEHMIDQLKAAPPALIRFVAERGGSSTLQIDAEMRERMLVQLRAFLRLETASDLASRSA